MQVVKGCDTDLLSHCRWMRKSRDAPRSNSQLLLSACLAALNTCCSLWVITFGMPARRELQQSTH